MRLKQVVALGFVVAILLTGCGLSGQDASLSGVVSQGAPLIGANLSVIDAKGQRLEGVISDANGAYKFNDISKLTAPLLISATGSAGGQSVTLYGLLEKKVSNSYANVSPLTDAIVTQAAGKSASLIEQSAATELPTLDLTKVEATKSRVVSAVANVLDQIRPGASVNFDPLKSRYAADGNSAEDKVLDLVKVVSTVKSSGIEVSVIDKSNTVGSIQLTPGGSVQRLASLPEEIVAVNYGSLQKLVTDLNVAFSSAANLDGNIFSDLLDNAYLNNGETKQQSLTLFRATYRSEIMGAVVTNPSIEYCNVSKVCKVNATLKSASGRVGRMQEFFRYDPAAQAFKAVGNGRKYKADFGSTANKSINTAGGATYGVTIQFSIESSKGGGWDVYKRATVELKAGPAAQPDLSYSFVLKPSYCSPSIGRYYDGMPLDNSVADDCSTWQGFDSSNESILKIINQKIAAGGYLAVFSAWKTYDKSDIPDVETLPIKDAILNTDTISLGGYPVISLFQASNGQLPYLSISNYKDFSVSGSLCITSNSYCSPRIPVPITTIQDASNVQLPARIDASAKDGWLATTRARGYFVHVNDKFGRDLIVSGTVE